MAQFDVYANPNPDSASIYPYFLDIQSTLLTELPTTVVIPLAVPEMVERLPILRLNPKVKVAGESLFVMTQELASINRRPLKNAVANLASERDALLAALDLLFTGF
jgi:toxin CcdB